MNINKINNNFTYKYILIIVFNLIILILIFSEWKNKYRNRIGVVGVRHEVNIGNNLIKYAISIKLKELGYVPYIIGTHWKNYNITFINQTTNLVIINNSFTELKEDDYDFLIVNSDQTWYRYDEHFYDYGFLKFAENWKIRKFVYGASIGHDFWTLNKTEEQIAKGLVGQFSGISVREMGSIKLIKQHLGITPTFVLDPTFLIDKKYYLDIIKNYKGEVPIKKKYIFIYNINNNTFVIDAVNNATKIFDFDTYYFNLNNESSIQNFIYYMVNSEAVITNAFHGTVFSIIFNKPFITIYKRYDAIERFNSLDYLFGVRDRLYINGQEINFDLLIKPLKFNHNLLNEFKKDSINFIKDNLKKE